MKRRSFHGRRRDGGRWKNCPPCPAWADIVRAHICSLSPSLLHPQRNPVGTCLIWLCAHSSTVHPSHSLSSSCSGFGSHVYPLFPTDSAISLQALLHDAEAGLGLWLSLDAKIAAGRTMMRTMMRAMMLPVEAGTGGDGEPSVSEVRFTF